MPVPIQIPVPSTPVLEVNGTFKRAWRLFLLTLANKLLGAAGVAAVSSPDIAAPPAQIVTTDIVALTDPLVTSANAATQTAGYVQADVQSIATLANELKTDVNAIVTRQNLDAVLTNEVKAKLNTTLTYLSTIQTLSNEEKARFNELRDALNE